jgi:hypothetical protein
MREDERGMGSIKMYRKHVYNDYMLIKISLLLQSVYIRYPTSLGGLHAFFVLSVSYQ